MRTEQERNRIVDETINLVKVLRKEVYGENPETWGLAINEACNIKAKQINCTDFAAFQRVVASEMSRRKKLKINRALKTAKAEDAQQRLPF